MFKPVTKWAMTILHPDNIPEIIRKAVRLARTEKPGACHIELPEDIAKLSTKERPIAPCRFRRPVPDDKIVDQAFEQIKSAKRPVILAGNGCIRKRASKQLREFVSASGIPVISTFMAKGSLDMDDENCIYTIGLQSKDVVACALDAADVVITMGYDMVEYHPSLWNSKRDKVIIHADFLPAEIDYNYCPKMEVIGDLAHTLWMFNQRVSQIQKESYDLGPLHAARREMKDELSQHKDDDTTNLIRPQKALWDVRQVLGPQDILLSDVGAHKMWIARHYQCHEPNTCLIPNGFCSMGFALPGAIAASIVYPERRVLAICGDAGFLMNLQEMETAKRYNSNIVVMVWEDHEYGLIAWKQSAQFGHHTELSFNNPDWELLAKSFGWGVHKVQLSTQLKSSLESAFDEAGPSLIVIPIDYRENMKLTERLGNLVCPI